MPKNNTTLPSRPTGIPLPLQLSVLAKLSIHTIVRIRARNPKLISLSSDKRLKIQKIKELLTLTGRIPNAQFQREIMADFDKYPDSNKLDWMNIFDKWKSFILWNATPILVDEITPIPCLIEGVVLTRDGLMRVEIEGGFITFEHGKEIFTTHTHEIIAKYDIKYTYNHIVVRLPHQKSWSLVNYSVTDKHQDNVISTMGCFNDDTESRDIVDIVSDIKHLVALYSDCIVVYDWVNDNVLFNLNLFDNENDMTQISFVKIAPEFLEDGTIHRVLLSDIDNRYYKLYNFTSGETVHMEMEKSCSHIVPIFKDHFLWVLDQDNNQFCFDMRKGHIISKPAKMESSFGNIRKAAYIESIKRFVIIAHSGRAFVGDVSSDGMFINCGTLDYKGSLGSYQTVNLIVGPDSLALVGKGSIRYVAFRMNQQDDCDLDF